MLATELFKGDAVQRSGWDETASLPRSLKSADFVFSAQQKELGIREGLQDLYSNCNANLLREAEVNADNLDPTHLFVVAPMQPLQSSA